VNAPAERPLRVVVAEDSFLLRAGIVRVLEAAGFVMVGEARDADELLAQTREHRPDVVVTDIRMPPTQTDEGVRAAAVIRSEFPRTGVVVLSQYVKESYAVQLLEQSVAASATCSRTESWSRAVSRKPSVSWHVAARCSTPRWSPRCLTAGAGAARWTS
jgi:DNA-binding NarL/FixJ family response regulator